MVLNIIYTADMALASRLIGPDKATTKRIVPRRRRLIALVSALALVVAGCASEDADAPSAPAAPPRAGAAGSAPPTQIVATTTIWADVTRNVSCGGLAEVESILPPLADPHDFEPSMSDRAQLDEAHLIVANGLGLEEALEDTLASVEADGTPVFTAGDHMTILAFDAETSGGHDEEADHGAEDDQGHGSEDPHVWLDPLRVAAAVANLADALIHQAGLDADRVISCSDAYLADLEALHGDITATLEVVPAARRKLVTNHDSLGYFADRYGFEVIGTIIPAASTLAEPSPAGLEELAHLIEETGVPAIFAEELGHGSRGATALADRLAGVSVENLYTGALGPAGSGAETYLAMMRHNAETIAAVLAG